VNCYSLEPCRTPVRARNDFSRLGHMLDVRILIPSGRTTNHRFGGIPLQPRPHDRAAPDVTNKRRCERLGSAAAGIPRNQDPRYPPARPLTDRKHCAATIALSFLNSGSCCGDGDAVPPYWADRARADPRLRLAGVSTPITRATDLLPGDKSRIRDPNRSRLER
jgi:hypothetical protein